MSKIVVTAGPIPARLDSVKFLTNRFKGGLAVKTAEYLRAKGHDVVIVAWKFNKLDTTIPVLNVIDVVDYCNTVLSCEDTDAFILAAAVANLMPSKPYEGKFPSHNYKVGEKFDIQFEIAPRLIDQLKVKFPTTTLIGYKLFDGTNEQLIDAARHTLYDSKANLVFANNPEWAKDHKLAVTPDGSVFPVTFDEHLALIDKLVRERWFRTSVSAYHCEKLTAEDKQIIREYPKYKVGEHTFGCFAIRKNRGFITTTRGKLGGVREIAYVNAVHPSGVVYANKKATLNAPLLARIFELNPHINYLIHGHEIKGQLLHNEYEFPGSFGDLGNADITLQNTFVWRLKEHGYIAGFKYAKDCLEYCNENKLASV